MVEQTLIQQILNLIDLKAVIGIVLICYWLFDHSPKIIRKNFRYPGAKTYGTMIVAVIVSVASYWIDPSRPEANVMAYFLATSFYEAIQSVLRSQNSFVREYPCDGTNQPWIKAFQHYHRPPA